MAFAASRAVTPVKYGFNTQLVYAFTLTTKKERVSSKSGIVPNGEYDRGKAKEG